MRAVDVVRKETKEEGERMEGVEENIAFTAYSAMGSFGLPLGLIINILTPSTSLIKLLIMDGESQQPQLLVDSAQP